ncbi:MAG: sigma-70 family RNA polymerase sigma factor [Flavobacteriia bacterium]|nr:sigma-70 family RNA polymerase sigma factor [Flavobacteriia bacterium]
MINVKIHQNHQQIVDDLFWIGQAKKKPENFKPLYEKYHEPIFIYVYNRMNDRDLAKDITSQVFMKALKNISSFKDLGFPFSSWLFRIAKSEVYQHFRDFPVHRFVNIDTHSINDFIEELNEELFSENDKKKLERALKNLKEKELMLIEMKYFEKRSHKEIAEIIGITENNAKIKCFRALEKLKYYFYLKKSL